MTPDIKGWDPIAGALVARVWRWVHASLSGATLPEMWDVLAMDVHRHQVANDPIAAALAIATPSSVWDISPVPVDLYKRLNVGTVAPGDQAVAFKTSGTTRGGRGVHRMQSAALYEMNALLWAQDCLPSCPGDVIALLSDPAKDPASSLSHMVGLFPHSGGEVTWHLKAGQLDRSGLNQRVSKASGPVFMAATAFALAQWLEGECHPLPAGSVLMVTGGFKGRVHAIEGDEMYHVARERLAPERMVTEYGMTELSSQLWGAPDTPFIAPPWLQVRAVEPRTGKILPDGEVGQLRFWDLCNVDSSLVIDTLDGGSVRGQEVTLFGRLPGSPARGCSLTVEEAWLSS